MIKEEVFKKIEEILKTYNYGNTFHWTQDFWEEVHCTSNDAYGNPLDDFVVRIMNGEEVQVKCLNKPNINFNINLSSTPTFSKVKPFLKCLGGKQSCISEIEKHLPRSIVDGKEFVYVEPFLGGGSVLIHMLQNYPNMKEAIVMDTNQSFMNAFGCIKHHVDSLIDELKQIEVEYTASEDKNAYYLQCRKEHNEFFTEHKNIFSPRLAALVIFLNKTCFNGLFRLNSEGEFNVPFGHNNGKLFDEDNLRNLSVLFKKVYFICCPYNNAEVITSSYSNDTEFFMYLDPPMLQRKKGTDTINSMGIDDHCDILDWASNLQKENPQFRINIIETLYCDDAEIRKVILEEYQNNGWEHDTIEKSSVVSCKSSSRMKKTIDVLVK